MGVRGRSAFTLSQRILVYIAQVDADNYMKDPVLAKVRRERGYSYEDQVTLAPGVPSFAEMVRE